MLADPEAPAADLQGALDNHEFRRKSERSDGVLGKRNCQLCKGHLVHTVVPQRIQILVCQRDGLKH